MTTSPDRLRPRSARMRAALTGPEWRRVSAMAAVIIALHVIGWVTLVFVVAPQHFSLGDKALGVGVGLTAYTLGMRHAFDADHIAAIDNTTRKLMNDWIGGIDLNTMGFFIVGLFILTLAAAILVWKYGRIEDKWNSRGRERAGNRQNW